MKNLSPEYESLLGLKKYLNNADAKELEQMILDARPLDEINIWINNLLTIRQIKKSVVHTSAAAAMEYKEYEHLLSKEEKQYIKKFYHERYANALYDIPKEHLLHNSEEMIKESNRINYSSKNDIFDVAEKKGSLLELDDERYNLTIDSDEDCTWEEVYSCFGYNAAIEFLIDECLEELKVNNFDKRLALVRYYIKMNRLRLANNKDQRNPKKRKKNEG